MRNVIGRNLTLVLASALALTACGGSGAGGHRHCASKHTPSALEFG